MRTRCRRGSKRTALRRLGALPVALWAGLLGSRGRPKFRATSPGSNASFWCCGWVWEGKGQAVVAAPRGPGAGGALLGTLLGSEKASSGRERRRYGPSTRRRSPLGPAPGSERRFQGLYGVQRG
jgi:hypothetical protein